MGAESVVITALVGAGGVVLGALVTTLVSSLNAWLQRKEDRHLATRQVREDQYFNATEILDEMRRELTAFQQANSGLGTTPDKSKSVLPCKNSEYRSSDRRSAQAIELLFTSAERIRLQKVKIEIVGSRRAAESFAKCYNIVDEYIGTVTNHILEDGRFNYDESVRYLCLYEELVNETIDLFREDLRASD